MTPFERKALINTILEREALRPLSRFSRLLRAPLRTFPYYILAALGHLKPFPITFPTLWGTHMTCYLPEGNTFYFYGTCEANLTNFFIRYLEDGMSVIDVGAHVGIYSMLASKLVGTNGRVYGFEPTPRTFALLTRNTERLKNVTVLNQAVAATPGTLTFADYGPGYGAFNSAHSAGGQGIDRSPHSITVQSTSLDTLCTKESLSPALVKIDAEGFEYEVLKGALNLLTTTRPPITLEVAGGDDWAKNRTDSFALLLEHRYQPYEIAPDGTVAKHTLKNSYTYENLVFLPEEQAEKIVTTVNTTV